MFRIFKKGIAFAQHLRDLTVEDRLVRAKRENLLETKLDLLSKIVISVIKKRIGN